MTDDSRTLATLIAIFLPLSLVSVGGGPAIFAEMQQQAVAINQWVTQREFSNLFAISRAAPGPGALLATLIGWKAAGWSGAVVATLAFFLPTSLLACLGAKLWHHHRASQWHAVIETGVMPITTGLVLAGAFVILYAETSGIVAWLTALIVATARLYKPNIHPLVLLGFGALVFVVFRHIG